MDLSLVVDELLARIREIEYPTVSAQDPVWARAINLVSLWDPDRVCKLMPKWSDEDWYLFEVWLDKRISKVKDQFEWDQRVEPFLISAQVVKSVYDRHKRKNLVLEGVAASRCCSSELLEVLAKNKTEDVRIAVAANSTSPFALLEVLAKDKADFVRCAVAGNLSSSEELLERLSKDRKDSVRIRVAGNPNSPLAVLEVLARDKSEIVRGRVARNPDCSAELRETLTKDDSTEVRQGVAENPNCPLAVLEILARDKSEYVRSSVARNPNCPVALIENEPFLVSQNPNCQATLLEVLAEDNEESVRWGVARNPNCPLSVLESLSKERNYRIRRDVAANLNCSVVLLKSLAKDREEEVRRHVFENPNFQVMNRPRLSQAAYAALIRSALIEQVELPPEVNLGDVSRALRAIELIEPNADHKTLDRLGTSKNWLERLAVCLHANATQEQRSNLTSDSHKVVASVALEMEAFDGDSAKKDLIEKNRPVKTKDKPKIIKTDRLSEAIETVGDLVIEDVTTRLLNYLNHIDEISEALASTDVGDQHMTRPSYYRTFDLPSDAPKSPIRRGRAFAKFIRGNWNQILDRRLEEEGKFSKTNKSEQLRVLMIMLMSHNFQFYLKDGLGVGIDFVHRMLGIKDNWYVDFEDSFLHSSQVPCKEIIDQHQGLFKGSDFKKFREIDDLWSFANFGCDVVGHPQIEFLGERVGNNSFSRNEKVAIENEIASFMESLGVSGVVSLSKGQETFGFDVVWQRKLPEIFYKKSSHNQKNRVHD